MDPHAPEHASAAPAVRDPEWNFWLGAMLLFLALLLLVFVRPAGLGAAQLAGASPPAVHGSSEQDRIADLLAGMAGLGLADDSVPPEVTEDIRYLIRRVAESGYTFVHNEVEFSAAREAETMLRRWENATSEIYSAETFIRRFAGFKLVDRLTVRVKFPDGTDKALCDWLRDQLSERPAGH